VEGEQETEEADFELSLCSACYISVVYKCATKLCPSSPQVSLRSTCPSHSTHHFLSFPAQGQLYRASSLAASQMDLAVFLHADILVILAILTGILQTAKLLRCLLLLIRECRAARRDASRTRGLAIAESFTNVLRAVLAMQGTGFLLPKFEEFLLGVNLFGNCLVGVFAYRGNTIVLELLLLVRACTRP
jgi:hypothetical protein